ncbi:MAG: hypothetical protein Q8O94_01535 [bacterium]|nr:hypothetical protein [bacterium]
MEGQNSLEKPEKEAKKDVFLLGGRDLEMYQIEKRLRRAGKEFVNRNLEWGAKIDDYDDVVQQILGEGNTPVAVELGGADKAEGVVDIDHHNEKFDRPASIVQIMNRLGKPVRLVDEMIAANDSAYIPGMEAKMEEYRAELEERYGHEKFEKLKEKLINLIRCKDREMQGVTAEMEQQAEEAIAHAEHGPNGLVIVRLPHNKVSPVTDRLFSTWADGKENLLVVCKDEVDYFGRGDICKEVKEKFSGWGGGKGYGDREKNGFCGVETSNPQEIIDFIIEQNA